MALLRTSEVKKLTTIRSYTTIRSAYEEGNFPPPIKLSKVFYAWDEDELKKWILGLEKIKDSSYQGEFIVPAPSAGVTIRCLSLRDVLEKVGIRSSTTIYEWMKKGKFPCRRRLLGKRSVWLEHEVQAWDDSQKRNHQIKIE